METDTKAMGLQEAKDYIVSLYGKKDWTDLLIYELECEGKNFNDEAAELYKDSCLAAQKAELKEFIKEVADWDKDYSSTMLRLKAKQLLKS